MSEQEKYSPEDMNKALFSHLVMSLATSAMQHMGKLVDPATGKTAVNIDAAESTIDVIDMLQAKTKGNLDHEESRFLEQTLTGLRLNYVEVVKTASANPPATPPPAPEPPADDKKRFSKKYE